MTAGAQEQQRHTASLAVWDVPVAVPAGEAFSVKAGVKSSRGVPLGGGRIAVHDSAGTVLAHGLLGDRPWPGSEALYWTEIALSASADPGTLTLSARFDGNANVPHESASSAFSINIVACAEHTLTVTVEASGAPLAEAVVRLGAYRAPTDAAGMARVRLTKGSYDLVVWKTGYAMTAMPIVVEADSAITIATQPVAEENADAVWTA